MAKNIISIAYEGQLTSAPNTGAGHPAAIGSLLPRVGTTELWVKFGAGNTDWQLLSSGSAGAILFFGNDDINAAADTRFLHPGRVATAGLTDNKRIPVTRGGVLKNFFVRQDNGVGDGDTVVYTVMVNGVATTLTVTLASNLTTTGSDIVNSATVVAGDLVSVRAVKAANITNGNLQIGTSVELV